MLEANVDRIKSNIQKACKESQRSDDEITLIAVTKTVSSEEAKQLVELGVVNIAENRVDKMLEKQEDLKGFSEIKWHLIGNLQRRKVKSIINKIDYFHALDSLKLAEEIEKRAEHKVRCFVEVNVSGEEQKHGLAPDEVEEFVQHLEIFPHIVVVGLMTMAPLQADEEDIKRYFISLHNIQEKVAQNSWGFAPCHYLSMGMSQDYPLAIQAGATHVRIGTAFFSSDN